MLVIANVVPSSPIIVTLMIEGLLFPKRRFLQEPHGVTSQKTAFLILPRKSKIVHSINRLGSLAETECVSCEVRTGFYIPEDDILHSHSCENLKFTR
jgi:hypothetical protein